MRERLHHLAAVEALQNENEPEFARWADTRLDRWLVDWSLRNGKEKTARKIAEDKDIEVRLLPSRLCCYSLASGAGRRWWISTCSWIYIE
jgi:hypothetical protein